MTNPPTTLKVNDTIAYQDSHGVAHFGCIVGPYSWDATRNDWSVQIRIRIADSISTSVPIKMVRVRVLASSVEAWPRSRAMRDEIRYTNRIESDTVELAQAS